MSELQGRFEVRRLMFWAVALAVLAIVVFNVQGWLVLSRTSRALERELGNRLQSLAGTLASAGASDYATSDGRRRLVEAVRQNELFNLFIVDEGLNYVLNARDPRRAEDRDPASELDAGEVLSAFAGLEVQPRLYRSGGYYLASAFAPLRDSSGIVTAVLGVEADARYFATLAGFRNSLFLINGLSLLAIVLIVLVSVSLVRHALRLEQAAARANTLALMGQMSGAVAHELKNPLGIVRAAAERLQKHFDPERGEPAFGYITEEVDRLNRIVSNYLSMGAARPASAEAIDLKGLIKEIVDGPALQAAEREVELKVSLDSLPPVPGNRLELRQVFLNLLLNSVQAQQSGGRVEVTGRHETRKDRGWVRVKIADQGPGIDEHDLRRVFEPFYTTKEKGSGLGLFIVRRVVEAHGGQVVLTSRKGKGTSAEVSLPAAKAGG